MTLERYLPHASQLLATKREEGNRHILMNMEIEKIAVFYKEGSSFVGITSQLFLCERQQSTQGTRMADS